MLRAGQDGAVADPLSAPGLPSDAAACGLPRKKIGIFTVDLVTPSGASRKACLMAERLARRHEVWMISLDAPDVAALERSFGISLAGVRFYSVDTARPQRPSLWDRLAWSLPKDIRTIAVQLTPYRRLRALDLDLFVLNTGTNAMRPPAPRSILMCMFPRPLPEFPRPRWCRLPLVRQLIDRGLGYTLDRYRHAPATYDLITANSAFTASWIRRRWNREARVIYSATELGPPQSGVKEKIILNVGRINIDKQPHVLIEAFRELRELHQDGWELHIAGKVNPNAWARRYHEELVESARGLPVVFHYDPSIAELRALYGRSAIYWLAKGFDVPEHEPQRMEHFGNTPLEAMSAGAVPLVVDAGGPRETVEHAVNGFRWDTLEALREHTLRLARDPALLAAMRSRAQQIDPRFGVEPFLDSVDALVDEALAR